MADDGRISAPFLPDPIADRFQLGLGVALIGAVVVMWNVSGFLTQRIFSQMAFDDPLFVTIVNLACFSLCHIPELYRRCVSDDSTNGSPYQTRVLSAKFAILWAAMCYSGNWSLAKTTLSSNMILSSTSSVFTLLMGKLITNHNVSAAKVVGVMASVVGSVIIALHDSSPVSSVRRSSLLGDLVALLSAVLYSFYTIALAKCIGKDYRRFSFLSFFGWMGQYGLWLGLPLIVAMQFTGLHTIPMLSYLVSMVMLLNGLVSMVSDFLLAKAVLLTTPLIATVGLSTSIPVAMTFDAIFNGLFPTSIYLIGSVCILFGFILVNVEQLTMKRRCQPILDTSSSDDVSEAIHGA